MALDLSKPEMGGEEALSSGLAIFPRRQMANRPSFWHWQISFHYQETAKPSPICCQQLGEGLEPHAGQCRHSPKNRKKNVITFGLLGSDASVNDPLRATSRH
jgi:hypothetical protein